MGVWFDRFVTSYAAVLRTVVCSVIKSDPNFFFLRSFTSYLDYSGLISKNLVNFKRSFIAKRRGSNYLISVPST